jgi:hypothetical protein
MTPYLSPQPFDQFLQSVASANYEDYRNMPGTAVENAAAFDEIRAYILDRYKDMRADASYVENDGQIIDCIPAELHPAASEWNDYTSEPPAPPTPTDPESTGGGPPRPASPAIKELRNMIAQPQFRDATNTIPAGTTPVYRTTLEQMSRFRNPAAFSAKDSLVGASAAAKLGSSAGVKRYATGEEDVHNFGGASIINVWRAPAYIAAGVQVSISQQWYLAGYDGTLEQTVECGWHVDPSRYNGSQDPHLFVFATRNNYNTPDCVYNEDGWIFKRATPNPYVLPGAPLPYSQIDGTQIGYKMGYYFHDGKWCFYFEDQLIGYFPVDWFQNGPLTYGATRARFGGEVENRVPLLSWPGMGSGKHATEGFGRVAYQRGAFIHYASGGAFQANLAVAGSTNGPCYTVEITNHSSDPDWGTYLFFGGPGGQPC